MSDEKPVEELQTFDVPAQSIEVRNVSKRELGIFLLPWNTEVETRNGREMFERGAFAAIDPAKVRLRMEHQNPPAGKGISLEERDDGPYMTFKVSATQRGDEILALAADGVADGASVGFMEIEGGTAIEHRNGRRIRVHRKVDLREVSTTWQPVYERAAVISIRSKEPPAEATAEVAPMADSPAPENGATPEAPPPAAPVQFDTVPFERALEGFLSKFADRLEKLEERSRSEFTIPNGAPEKPKVRRGEWFQSAMMVMSGERIPELQMRALDDLITTDNIGLVPEAFLSEIIGIIDPRRPFLQTTRRINLPRSGMTLNLPKIVTKPTVGTQATEKAEITSTATSVTNVGFDAVTKAGGGDISIQLLKRSEPSYLEFYLELMAEAYALESESEGVERLLASGVNSGGALNPEDLNLGGAWTDTWDAMSRTPDTIWMSSAAVSAFIDAKASGTNAPLYTQITANFTAGGGVGGSISGLRAVHVPALNATDVDVVVGPSTGFLWTEDGTYTLQVDVPSKAGKDVAIVGMLWFAPLYPAAFTAYSVAGGGS